MGSELAYELNGHPHAVEWRDLQDAEVAEVENAFVAVLGQQRLEHGMGFGTVLAEDVALTQVVGMLAPGQRRLIEGDVANEVEGVEV